MQVASSLVEYQDMASKSADMFGKLLLVCCRDKLNGNFVRRRKRMICEDHSSHGQVRMRRGGDRPS